MKPTALRTECSKSCGISVGRGTWHCYSTCTLPAQLQDLGLLELACCTGCLPDTLVWHIHSGDQEPRGILASARRQPRSAIHDNTGGLCRRVPPCDEPGRAPMSRASYECCRHCQKNRYPVPGQVVVSAHVSRQRTSGLPASLGGGAWAVARRLRGCRQKLSYSLQGRAPFLCHTLVIIVKVSPNRFQHLPIVISPLLNALRSIWDPVPLLVTRVNNTYDAHMRQACHAAVECPLSDPLVYCCLMCLPAMHSSPLVSCCGMV